MVVKGPSSGQDIYDTPASTDKNIQPMVKLWNWISHVLICHISVLQLSQYQIFTARLITVKQFTLANLIIISLENKVNNSR